MLSRNRFDKLKIAKGLFLATNTLILLVSLVSLAINSLAIYQPKYLESYNYDYGGSFVRTRAIIALVVALIDIAVSILGYYGILKSRPWALFTYFVFNLALSVVYIVYIVVIFYMRRRRNLRYDHYDLFLFIVVCLLVLSVASLILCLVVAFMMRKRAKEASEPKTFTYGPPKATFGAPIAEPKADNKAEPVGHQESPNTVKPA